MVRLHIADGKSCLQDVDVYLCEERLALAGARSCRRSSIESKEERECVYCCSTYLRSYYKAVRVGGGAHFTRVCS